MNTAKTNTQRAEKWLSAIHSDFKEFHRKEEALVSPYNIIIKYAKEDDTAIFRLSCSIEEIEDGKFIIDCEIGDTYIANVPHYVAECLQVQYEDSACHRVSYEDCEYMLFENTHAPHEEFIECKGGLIKILPHKFFTKLNELNENKNIN